MPIKLLHFADLHLGVENYGKINPKTGLNTRFEDFARTLESVVDYALSQGVHLVIFSGDAYKNREPTPTHQRTFARALRRLSGASIQTVVLVGNHDVPNTRGRAHSVEVFRVLDVPCITVADSPALHRLETAAGAVQVIVLPYRRPTAIGEQQEAMRGKTQAEIAEAIVRDYSDQLERMAEELDPTLPTVLAAHLAVGGAAASSERSMLLSDEPTVSLSTLLRPELNLDYVALGHMHKYQNLNSRGYPPVIYSGSLERVDFGEEKDEKGFVVVQLERGTSRYQFVPVEARPFVTIECQISSDDPVEQLEAAVRDVAIEGAVVRLRYTIPEDQKMAISNAHIQRLLARSYHIGRVEREVTRPDGRQRDPHLTDSLDAYSALSRYLAQKPPKVSTPEVLEYGKMVIEELERQESSL